MKIQAKRLFCSLLVVIMLLSTLSMTALATIGSDSGRSKSKTATPLDGKLSTVTLSLPAESKKHTLDVVFVLDGSTSTDEDELATEAAALLDELATMDINVNAGLVIFGGSSPILYNSGLLNLSQDENLTALKAEIKDKTYNTKPGRSGSNLQAGVDAARELLNSSTTDKRSKYMILLTDGAARMWQDEEGNALSQTYLANLDDLTKIFWNSNSDWLDVRYKNTPSDKCPTFAQTWADGQAGITIGNYAMTEAQKTQASPTDEGVASYETVQSGDYYTTYEAAIYYAAKSIMEAKNEANVFLISYPYHPEKTLSCQPYIESFKVWLAENGVKRYDNNDDTTASAIFSNVETDLIQLVDAGSYVVDIIGEDFDLYIPEGGRLADAFKITVNGVSLNVTDTNADTNTVTFGNDITSNQFSITYDKTDTLNETIKWSINVPITIDAPVQLSYQVELVNIPETSKDNIPTNESAILYPKDTEGTKGEEEEFEVPKVSYKVNAPGLEKWILADGEKLESDTIAAGDTVNFELSSNVPDTLLNYLDLPTADTPTTYAFESEENSGQYWFAFHDVMDPKLTLVPNTITLKIGDKTVSSNYYEVVTNTTDGCTFEVKMNLVALYEAEYFTKEEFGSAKIVLTYSATASKDLEAGEYHNTAWIEYEGGDTEKDTVTVETYGIKIFKYDQADQTTGLAGAEFELCDSEKNVITTVTSGRDGYITIEGLDEGIYYLTETKAPSGYVKSDDYVLIEIPDDANAANIVNVKFANAEIPHTGGSGTVMYTVGGIAILAAAAILFVISRKKKTNQ